MQSIPSFLRKLLETGMVERENKEITLSMLNDYLKPIGYLAIKWPDSETVVLKNFRTTQFGGLGNILSPWKESTANEAKKAIYEISLNRIPSPIILDLLEEYNYVKRINGDIKLTLRSLINFENILIQNNPAKYKKCEGCSLIVEDSNKHLTCSGKLEIKFIS